MIDPYVIIQHQSLKDTEALVIAHEDMQAMIETDPCPPPISETVPAPTSPTVPAKRAA